MRELFLTARKLLKSRGLLIIAYSSVTGAREVNRLARTVGFHRLLTVSRVTPLDTVYVSVFAKTGRTSHN